MYKLKIMTIGKNKEPWLKEALAEYEKRLKKSLSLEWLIVKELYLPPPPYVVLSSEGRRLTSEGFAEKLFIELSKGILTFLIGGPLGLPPALRKEPIWSLSSLTFTHQMTRLILLEQIYRSFEIAKKSPYHK